MKLSDLREFLEDHEDLPDDTPVLIVSQPHWPLIHEVKSITTVEDLIVENWDAFASEDTPVLPDIVEEIKNNSGLDLKKGETRVYIAEGSYSRYANELEKGVWSGDL